jgi:hypothetical protein
MGNSPLDHRPHVPGPQDALETASKGTHRLSGYDIRRQPNEANEIPGNVGWFWVVF